MATKNITFDPDSGVPYGLNLTIYGGSDFSTNLNVLDTSNSASSIKIIVAAHIGEDADLRAFFAVNGEPGLDPIFTPFPGYLNLNSRGQVIAKENNNGESDSYIVKSNTKAFDSENIDYREYTFTIDQLPAFRNYRVKLSLISKSQCFVPRVKDLRVIALA